MTPPASSSSARCPSAAFLESLVAGNKDTEGKEEKLKSGHRKKKTHAGNEDLTTDGLSSETTQARRQRDLTSNIRKESLSIHLHNAKQPFKNEGQ